MHKYEESKMIRIMMATVCHVTAWARHTKYQAAWFLLNRVYNLIHIIKPLCSKQGHCKSAMCFQNTKCWNVVVVVVVVVVVIIIIIIIIIIHFPYFIQFSGSEKSTVPTDQALLIHCSAKNVLTVQHVLSITTFCVRICRPGWRLSSFKLPCNLFGIIPIVGASNGIV